MKGVEMGGVLHWYDFVCPFCYVGQARTAVLERGGLPVTELPFEAHPEIPEGGRAAGARVGPMFAMLDREAATAGLPLHWPPRLLNTRRALACAEWVRRTQPEVAGALRRSLFRAHFADGLDLGDGAVLDERARSVGVDVAGMWRGVEDGLAYDAVAESEALGRRVGVRGTPAWLIGERLVEGLQAEEMFARVVA